DARAYLEECRQGRVAAEFPATEPLAPDAARPPADASPEALQEAINAAEDQLLQLKGLGIPKLFKGAGLVGVFILVALVALLVVLCPLVFLLHVRPLIALAADLAVTMVGGVLIG